MKNSGTDENSQERWMNAKYRDTQQTSFDETWQVCLDLARAWGGAETKEFAGMRNFVCQASFLWWQ